MNTKTNKRVLASAAALMGVLALGGCSVDQMTSLVQSFNNATQSLNQTVQAVDQMADAFSDPVTTDQPVQVAMNGG